jgi:hypothetical protein
MCAPAQMWAVWARPGSAAAVGQWDTAEASVTGGHDPAGRRGRWNSELELVSEAAMGADPQLFHGKGHLDRKSGALFKTRLHLQRTAACNITW